MYAVTPYTCHISLTSDGNHSADEVLQYCGNKSAMRKLDGTTAGSLCWPVVQLLCQSYIQGAGAVKVEQCGTVERVLAVCSWHFEC